MTTPNDERLAQLHLALDALIRPELAKCDSPTWDELCQRRAAAIYQSACRRTRLSERQIASRIERDPRMQTDYVDGSRQVPLKAVLKLPRSAVITVAEELARYAATLSEDDSENSERGAA